MWPFFFTNRAVVVLVVALSFVAVLGVAFLQCGRFDQDPLLSENEHFSEIGVTNSHSIVTYRFLTFYWSYTIFTID